MLPNIEPMEGLVRDEFLCRSEIFIAFTASKFLYVYPTKLRSLEFSIIFLEGPEPVLAGGFSNCHRE
jgi:hypothetical protein